MGWVTDVGSKDKREQRLFATGRNVRLGELIAVMEAAGFTCAQGGRGHWCCRHAAAGVVVNVAAPHGREDRLLPPYVKAAREALAAVRAWQAEQGEPDEGSD